MWKWVHFQLFADDQGDMHERLSELEDRLRSIPGVADAEAAKGEWEIAVRHDSEQIGLDELAALVRQMGLIVVPDRGSRGGLAERPFKDFDEETAYKEPPE